MATSPGVAAMKGNALQLMTLTIVSCQRMARGSLIYNPYLAVIIREEKITRAF
jgi:hypothetical protein